MRGLACTLLIAALATSARADPAGTITHRGQFEVSLRLPLALRAITPYESKDYCGATDSSAKFGNAAVCTGRAPFGIDLELGYGIARRVDLFLETRLSLEADFGATPASTDGPHPFHVSPGARFFFSEGGRTKLFTTAQFVFDFTGYQDAAGASRGTDYGVRNLNGLWIDLEQAYGVYAFVGETATVSRWLRLDLEAGIGIQGRYR